MAAMVELILLSRINAKALWKAISNLCIDPTAPAERANDCGYRKPLQGPITNQL